MRTTARFFAASLALLAACSTDKGSSGTGPAADATASTDGIGDTKAGDTVKTDTATDTGKTDTGKVDAGKDVPVVAEDDDKIEGATEIQSGGQPVEDALEATGDVDWYKFTGKKGDLIFLSIATAQTNDKLPFDKDTIDAVLTLYGPDKKRIAYNDDPTPRSTNDSAMWSVLPADGDYYVQVTECQTWLTANPTGGAACAEPHDKTNTDYSLSFGVIDLSKAKSIIKDTEKGDDAASANVVPWAKGADGKYVAPLLFGTFSSATDVDVYKVTIPAELTATTKADRTVIGFEGLAGGEQGDGSTADPGIAWIASEATPTAPIAQVDLATGQLNVPLPFGQTYFLFVQHAPGGKTGANDFYIISNTAFGSNPLEKNDAGNDKPEGAEVLASQKTGSGANGFYFEGDLLKSGKDVDHFKWAVPAGDFDFYVYCGAQNEGSGLRGFKVEVLDESGAALSGGGVTESADKGIILNKDKFVPPATAKNLMVRLTADHQDDKVSSTFYRCVVLYADKIAP
jgi:hypothetical protein